jgi:hypothetical protein
MNISYLATLFASLSVALYIELPIVGKPYILLLAISFCFMILKVTHEKRICVSFPVLFVMVFFIVYLFKMALSYDPLNFKYIFNILVFPIVYICGRGLNIIQKNKILFVMLFVSVFVFIFEAYYRFSHPVVGGAELVEGQVREGASFYMFKINSLMYNNSNGVAMHLTFLVSLILSLLMFSKKKAYFNNRQLKCLVIYLIIFLVLTVMTLSRAAMLTELILLFLFLTIRFQGVFKFNILFLPIISFMLIIGVVLRIEIDDVSLLTKLEILNNLLSYLKDASIGQILFGNVLNDYGLIFNGFKGYYGHTHYFELIFTGGFVFSILYLLMLLVISTYIGKNSIFFLFAFFILGFSNIRLFGHYLFYVMALLCLYSSKEGKYETKSFGNNGR